MKAMKNLDSKELARVNGGAGGVNDLSFTPRPRPAFILFSQGQSGKGAGQDTWSRYL